MAIKSSFLIFFFFALFLFFKLEVALAPGKCQGWEGLEFRNVQAEGAGIQAGHLKL